MPVCVNVRVATCSFADLGLKVRGDGEREAEVLVEELLRGELADVHAHALASRLLQKFALFDDETTEGSICSAVCATRADEETEERRSDK